MTIQQLPVRTYFKNSRSQLLQDFFVLRELKFKRNGFFVEFGANDGLIDSNTYLLEYDLGWHGILAEPARICHPALFKNRPNCAIDTSCVWSATGASVEFFECKNSVVSTVEQFKNTQAEPRQLEGYTYFVNTISLVDLLDKYQAPPVIDYLSMDTEGTEFEILNAFDWDRYKFRVITCEHNRTQPMRRQIFELLSSHGYTRKFTDLSLIDDWYVLENY